MLRLVAILRPIFRPASFTKKGRGPSIDRAAGLLIRGRSDALEPRDDRSAGA
jgi:hypothetical protein